MSWFGGKVSLGGFPDLSGGFPDISGAVTKFSESVKNIEKNFDSALGLEEKSESGSGGSGDGSSSGEASGLWRSATDRKALFEPMMSFMGQKGEESTIEDSEKAESSGRSSFEEQKNISTDKPALPVSEQTSPAEKDIEEPETNKEEEHLQIEGPSNEVSDPGEAETDSQPEEVKTKDSTGENVEMGDSPNSLHQEDNLEMGIDEVSQSVESTPRASVVEQVESSPRASVVEQVESSPRASMVEQVESSVPLVPDESYSVNYLPEEKRDAEDTSEKGSDLQAEVVEHEQPGNETDASNSSSPVIVEAENASEVSNEHLLNVFHSDLAQDSVDISVPQELSDSVSNFIEASQQANDFETDTKEQRLSLATNVSVDSALDIETVKMEMKMMEAALQGAARQSQAKADEIAKLMNENEQLKVVIEDLKRKSSDAEIESLREEYHQRVSTLERKVYALTKERDTLRREQNRKSDAAALLKEKDEIITQVMAEGEELSKKQATQESHIRKLRAQIREFEEEKKGLITKLQVEENKMESIKKDKAVTEKYLQETIEKHQAELAAQKEHYTNALNAAKEAEALAEARANKEARTELESRLREAEERESTLVQALEELRQTLSRKEQQTAFREDMLRKDIDDLQKRYQESERRCEELVTQVPESTRPLLRQIEAIQEATARKAEAWAGVERSLNSRLQEAEAKAAGAEENERAMNERLSQTLSRMAVLEAQVSCLRAEQTQLSRSLDKERQRASENRQEYLAAQEAVATYEGRVKQLEEEIKELKRKHKHEMQEIVVNRELLQQELEREKAARLDLERTARVETSSLGDQAASTKHMNPYLENGNSSARKLSSAGSLGSMEESFFLQASLDSTDSFSDRRHSEATTTPYYLKSMTPSAFEATVRQKDGELASYMSRLASLESIRDSLAEELVKMTAQCEKLRAEAAIVPGVRAELEALRRRHSAALELMGERDEELEELRADIMDLKEMYREQVNLLVNKIQVMSSSIGAS